MKKFKILVIVTMFFVCHPVSAVEVSICNQGRDFLEVTDLGEVLAEAGTGECFTMEIMEKERLLINFGMIRHLFDFSFLKHCIQDEKVKLVASNEGKLYCNSTDQQQPKGFPLEAWKKIDLI